MEKFMLIMQVLAVLPGILKAVQDMVPSDSGNGKTKLDAAIEMLTLVVGNITKVMPQVMALIEVLVAVGKKTGGLPAGPVSIKPIDENNAMQ